MNGQNILMTDNLKFLGVTIDSTLNWSRHICRTNEKKSDKAWDLFTRPHLSYRKYVFCFYIIL